MTQKSIEERGLYFLKQCDISIIQDQHIATLVGELIVRTYIAGATDQEALMKEERQKDKEEIEEWKRKYFAMESLKDRCVKEESRIREEYQTMIDRIKKALTV